MSRTEKRHEHIVYAFRICFIPIATLRHPHFTLYPHILEDEF